MALIQIGQCMLAVCMCMCVSLVPRLSTPPGFDHFHTASNQKLECARPGNEASVCVVCT